MLYNPSIITKCLSTQAVYINKSYGQMFYYTDKRQIWFDTQQGGRTQANNIYICDFERDRLNLVPTNSNPFSDFNILAYSYVYVIETNSLYSYEYSSQTWTIIYGIYGSNLVAQTYLPEGKIVDIYADDVTTNGILNDGSVVIRDINRMICGLAKSDGYAFYVQSLIGGQINFDPSSTNMGDGCLQLNSENRSANLNGDLIVFGNIRQTSKSNWVKQYRLITEDTKVFTNTLIKKGSTLKASSVIGDQKYNQDTKLIEDKEFTSGVIAQNSKIYINSVVNNELIKPPFVFDLENDVQGYTPQAFEVLEDKWGVQGSENGNNQAIMFNINNPLVNTGDIIYINSTDSLSKIKSITFLDGTSYIVEKNQASTGLTEITYNKLINKVTMKG